MVISLSLWERARVRAGGRKIRFAIHKSDGMITKVTK